MRGLPTVEELAAIRDLVSRDDFLAMSVAARFETSGLMDALGFQPKRVRPTVPVMPDKFTALQLGIWDNGYSRDKRGRERVTKTRWGIDIKVWTDEEPDWKSPAYRTTVSMWSAEFAKSHIAKLAERGSISADFAAETLALIGTASGIYVGIPRSKVQGTKYEDGAFYVLVMDQSDMDVPLAVLASLPNAQLQIKEFTTTDAKGSPLSNVKRSGDHKGRVAKGEIVMMARVSMGRDFGTWSTQTIDVDKLP